MQSNKNNSKKQNGYVSQPPKKSMVIRILILTVAVLMFVGAIVFPFMSSGIFG